MRSEREVGERELGIELNGALVKHDGRLVATLEEAAFAQAVRLERLQRGSRRLGERHGEIVHARPRLTESAAYEGRRRVERLEHILLSCCLNLLAGEVRS